VPASISRSERQLVLLAAGTAARRSAGAEQARRLMANVDWPLLTENLRARRLLTVLGPRILEISGGEPEESLATVVAQALETGRRQSVFLQLTSDRAMEMLADAGLRSSALKGPKLGEAIYGDPGRRLSSDIDLLVSSEQLPAAVEVVRRLGYAAPTDYLFADGLPLLHLVLEHERSQLPPVELHWRVQLYERDFARERLLTPTVDQSGRWLP
jgi:hypothetical protein